jgi:ATP-dependent helicase/nuclease subunit B
MPAIAHLPLENGATDLWTSWASVVRGWLDAKAAAARDTIVLLPFAALLAPARAAFAAGGGWQPRIETPLTLAAAVAPPLQSVPGAVSGDVVLDRLHAAALLRDLPSVAQRERDDPRSFAHVVGLFVDAAQALRRASLAHAPARREAFWAQVRRELPTAAGPGAFEALLLRAAAEWAAVAAPAPTDVLHTLQPAAWVGVRLGGRDAVAEAVFENAACPALVVDMDAGPFSALPQRVSCDDREHEAQGAASQVIEALNAGRVPVALVALDRELVRRVRALLDRQQVPLVDETGWALSTTVAAARLMSELRAALPDAGPDARLDWLKGWPAAAAGGRALESLEADWRRARRVRDPGAAEALRQRAAEHLAPYAARRDRTLAGWLALLQDRLQAGGLFDALRNDAAGLQLLQALRFDAPQAAWREAAQTLVLDLPGFVAWVDATLEAAPFEPPPAPGAEVVLTPLARAIGRPFAHIVIPGADAVRLGRTEPASALIGETLAARLGVENAASRRERQRLAFLQALRAPAVTLLRRRRDGDEPIAPSPEVEAFVLERQRAGLELPAERHWQAPLEAVERRPVERPAARAPADLPEQLSASTIEALRECPYRFFGRAVLRLGEADELEAGVRKRDFGNWLHGVLHRFHAARIDGGDDAALLQQAADEETEAQDLDAAELLPYRAGFEPFVPAYLAWLARRDAEGWRWEGGETDRTLEPPELAPQRLGGRLDRVDRAPDGSLQVIDYKTGAASGLRAKVADPNEDTQLAFYAALEPRAETAMYLALDDPKAPLPISHPGVRTTAALLVERVADEMRRLREGAPMLALGEGRACEFCEARGLCRKDHWPA